MDAYVYVKQQKHLQDGQSVFFNVHKCFICPDHVARQAADAERKLQTSDNDGEKKGWDMDKYVALHKEQHAIINSLTDHGYSGMDDGTKVHHFLQGIKSTEFNTAAHLSGPNQKSLVQILTQCVLSGPNNHKERPLNAIHPHCENQKSAGETKSDGLHGEVEWKKYHKAVCNSMTKEQQMQVRKLCEQ